MTQQPNGSAHTGRSRDKGKKEVKIVIVGDGGCGKTSLLMVYAKGAFPERYAPSVFEKYMTTITIGNKDVDLHLYDTAGQEDYDRLRPLSYQDVNLVLICYDVTSPTSFDNVLIKWYPEVNHFCRGVPIILIGCKTDLRKDKERLRKLKTSQQEPITYNQAGYDGEAICKNIQAVEYLECSAKFQENVDNVFREATLIALNSMKKEEKLKRRQKKCRLL
ncbi:rho-related GTP-binding [Pelobates cultripes]|uniref:Rho-related GTP-binding n=1 Tax=Pelobates cultripes TaxID=61616 RepID=A0AAD1S9T2_PELCU|nr:rho-related GTP-binding [Pelobates cultripes]